MNDSAYYEDAEMLSEYLLFHYGSDEEILPWAFGPIESTRFPERLAHRFTEYYPARAGKKGALRALDIGCAVGRTSFELTRFFDEVVGIDYSRRFIEAAEELREKGQLSFFYKVQGDIRRETQARISKEIPRNNVRFKTGNAMELKADKLGQFDLIVASNLICRLPDPRRFLQSLPDLLNEGGVLLLSSPFTWMETFTARDNWLGGRDINLSAKQAVAEVLDPAFTSLEWIDMPMLIREHERKFQWTVCSVSAWKKRGLS